MLFAVCSVPIYITVEIRLTYMPEHVHVHVLYSMYPTAQKQPSSTLGVKMLSVKQATAFSAV